MNPDLSICVPTFNRLTNLRDCVESVMTQVSGELTGRVELVIVSNACTDGTDEWARNLVHENDWIRFCRNPANLGFDGNTIRCLEAARGRYIALLSDDDHYEPGTVGLLLEVTAQPKYSVVLLNYYGYIPGQPGRRSFATHEDREFTRGFDVMNYPSVGHFSGFVYHGGLAHETLAQMRVSNPELAEDRLHLLRERRVGVYNGLAARMTLSSSLPTRFVGRPMVAARSRTEVTDKCGVKPGIHKVREMCTTYYQMFLQFHLEGLLPAEDLAFREKLAVGQLPKALLQSIPYFSTTEARTVGAELASLFPKNRQVRWIWRPLTYLARAKLVRWLFGLSEAPMREIAQFRRRSRAL